MKIPQSNSNKPGVSGDLPESFRLLLKVGSETGMDKGYVGGFMADFAGAGARDVYLIDERHQLAGAKLVDAAEGGVAGILVYDLEIDVIE